MKGLILYILIGLPVHFFAQNCLHGTILDGKKGEPIPYAKIYIPEEEVFALSREDGTFSICNLREGTFTIQVRSYGFESFTTVVDPADSAHILIVLNVATKDYPDVLVYANRVEEPDHTPNNIVALTTEQMRESGAMSLSDGIASIPGVDQLTTGSGISKPVIRGLYGNRIQTVMLGLRFDNQQWQDEHGLGLTDVGISGIEIVKGPASLLFGSEAMGGVLNILEEKPAPQGEIQRDISTRFFSNTFGIATDLGVKGAGAKLNWRVRAGYESHADYTDGNNKRLLNSRFGGYYAKASIGFHRKKWNSQNHYMFSNNNFGFIMDSALSILKEDNRQSRLFDMPHHSVFLHAFSSQNSIRLKRSELKLILGLQLNDRQEQEGGSKISLDMFLSTGSLNALWVKKLSGKTKWTTGVEEVIQNNRNLGSRMIVPDADLFESSVYSYVKHDLKKVFLEGGLRYSLKNIQTYTTGDLNSGQDNPGTDILPFNKWFQALTGAAGICYTDKKHWTIKSNLSSGYRAGNLAELSSNGLHEGSIRYEIGNVNMKTEQNLCGDLYAAYEAKGISVTSSAYVNYFYNYIYLAPTDEEFIGYQIFRYVQKDAVLKGMEAIFSWHPKKLDFLKLTSAYSMVLGQTIDGEYLPFIPSNKINSQLQLIRKGKGKWLNTYFRFGHDYVFKQEHPGQFETQTDSYYLLSSGIGATRSVRQKQLMVSVVCKNLLNNTYYDHLSRYKYFGFYNMGRNIVVNINYKF